MCIACSIRFGMSLYDLEEFNFDVVLCLMKYNEKERKETIEEEYYIDGGIPFISTITSSQNKKT